MTLLSSLFESRARVEGPYRLSDDGAVTLFSGQPNSTAGIHVSEEVAITYTNVFACVKIIAESIASLPLILYRKNGEDRRERATEDALYRLLHDAPNDDMTSIAWREAMLAHLLLWGNHYSVIGWRGTDVESITPVHPRWVTPKRAKAGGALVYEINPDDGQPAKTYRAAEVLHIPGLSFNGVKGLSVIEANREAIATGMATQQFGGSWFGNGAHPSGILSTKAVLKPEGRKRLKEQWNEAHQGGRNAGKTAVLDGEMTWQSVQINPKDAQMIEARAFSVGEIARIFRVPLVLLNAGEAGTSVWGSGVEQLMIAFVTHTLRPWFVRIEQEISRKLLWMEKRQGYYAEHLDAALLRGDLKSRYEAYAVGRQWGWLSPNDVRRSENMDPIDGEKGDEYISPANITGKAPAATAKPDSEEPDESDEDRAARILAPLLARDMEQIVETELKAFRQALERRYGAGIAEFQGWIDDFYRTFPAHVAKSLTASALAVSEALPGFDCEAWAREVGEKYAQVSASVVAEAVRKSIRQSYDSKAALTALLEVWQQQKSALMAAEARNLFAAEAAGGKDHERAA